MEEIIMTKKPLIGITLDHEANEKGFSRMPYYAARENYATPIEEEGATVVFLPHNPRAVSDYIPLLDGLLITGGNFDVSPEFFGEEIQSDHVQLKPKRTEFEMAITKEAFQKKMPILGICGGEQLLNVIFGGTLIQHIPDELPGALEHLQKARATEPGHSITLLEGTFLREMNKNAPTALVNSKHHQAVKTLGKGLILSAQSEDGVIEAFEHESHPFCIGVQWHPEFILSPFDAQIFKEFVKSASEYLLNVK